MDRGGLQPWGHTESDVPQLEHEAERTQFMSCPWAIERLSLFRGVTLC